MAHGKVVAAGGASVAIHIGSAARRADLYGDWILVHELFHLGFPSFSGEGKWLDEGLATYFEPIIHARAGWHSSHAVWREFARDMGQGLPAVEATGLEKATSFQGIYWGGAIIALLADVRTRQRTHGELGLEDGLRALLARGGDAAHLWKLDRAVAVIDERLVGTDLQTLTAAHRFGGNRRPRQTLRRSRRPRNRRRLRVRRARNRRPHPSSHHRPTLNPSPGGRAVAAAEAQAVCARHSCEAWHDAVDGLTRPIDDACGGAKCAW